MGKPITEIKKELEECTLEELSVKMQQYEQDERKGVQNLLTRCVRRLEEEKKEQQILRREYVDAFKRNLRGQLNNISIKEKDGSITNLGEKYGQKKGN